MDTVVDFSKILHDQKIDFLKDIFECQRNLAEENLNQWMLIAILHTLNTVYSNHPDEILNKLCGKKT